MMIAVIFEVWPVQGQEGHGYLDVAAFLKADLEKTDGFISIERFESLTTKGKYLSLSFWRDEEAIRTWRNHGGHRSAQAMGRGGLFSNYRLRVASIVREYGMTERNGAPEDSRNVHG